jgi:hypothetical protein
LLAGLNIEYLRGDPTDTERVSGPTGGADRALKG